MSLDIWPRLGSLRGEGVNITHNARPQIALAGADPWSWHERPVKETIREIQNAQVYLHDPQNREALEKLNPPNGWGSLDSSQRFLAELLQIAIEHQDCYWDVWK